VALAGGRVQLSEGGVLQAEVPASGMAQLATDPAVGSVSPAPVGDSDGVTTAGLTRIGADVLHAQGDEGAGVSIAILDQAFGPVSRLNQLAGTELPPLDHQQRRSFDETYGLAGRDFYGNASRHGEMLAEIAYDIAPAATYTYVNYRTAAEFDEAVSWLIDTVHPDIVIHANSFLFGPFNGTGWFARRVDRAAAAGILWVNSAGNYRDRHWEGPWSDANGNGALDFPGVGDAIPLQFTKAQHPSCDLSWTGPQDLSGANGYQLSLTSDADGRQPVIDTATAQPAVSAFVPAPEPHAELEPVNLPADGTYYLRVTRVGQPPPDRLTLFCRFTLPPQVQVAESSIPTPGDANGSFTVGAFDVRSLQPEPYSSEGPTDDGRIKPDIAAPTNVDVTGRSFGGTSCATPHAGAAAALLWKQVAAAGGSGSVADRVRARLVAMAADPGDPRPDERFGAGRLRLYTAAPALTGKPSVVAGQAIHGKLPLAFRIEDPGTLSASLTLDGKTFPSTLGPDRVLRGTLDTRHLPEGQHNLVLQAVDGVANTLTVPMPLTFDNTPPSLTLFAPGWPVLTGVPVRIHASASDHGSGVAGQPLLRFADSGPSRAWVVHHRFVDPGPTLVTAVVRDRAGNITRRGRMVHLVELKLLPAPSGPGFMIELGRPDLVTLVLHHDGHATTLVQRFAAGVHRVLPGPVPGGSYAVLGVARGFKVWQALNLRGPSV
jgi:hypothetical protein